MEGLVAGPSCIVWGVFRSESLAEKMFKLRPDGGAGVIQEEEEKCPVQGQQNWEERGEMGRREGVGVGLEVGSGMGVGGEESSKQRTEVYSG